MRCLVLLTLASLASGLSATLGAEELRSRVESYVTSHQKELLSELWQAVAIPAVAPDEARSREKAVFLLERLRRRGFEAELLETDGNPLVYGERRQEGASRTLLLYAHYDGQPVDPAKWSQDDPFRPVLRNWKLGEGGEVIDFAATSDFEPDWRLYGRSVSDDTAPIIGLLAALDALDSLGLAPTSNLRVVLDGEEEAGSPNLVPAIERYRDKLTADLMLILDGPLHQTGRPTLVYGARGNVTMELTVFGPRVPLHSGHYGNWVPNPAMRLAQLLASMKDDEGRVVVEGFYDGIELSESDERVLASVPDDLEGLERRYGFSETDRVGRTLQEALQYPSLNVRGLRSGWVGSEARTIIPDRAIAAVDVRLVAETNADVMSEKILAHIRKQGYHVVLEEPDDETRARHGRIVQVRRSKGTTAFRTSLEEPRTTSLVDALTETWNEPPIRMRSMGGTVPIAPFIETLGFAAIAVPTVNFDNNQHSPNENLRLGHFFDSVVSFAAIFSQAQPAPLGQFEGHGDVGSPALPGSATWNAASQEYRLTGAGVNMWGSRDEMQFAWTRLKGDFTLSAHVELLGEGVDRHRKAGVIARTSLEADSPYADAVIHGDGLTSLQYRRTKGAETEEVVSEVTGADVLQIQRKGTTLTISVARSGELSHESQVSALDLGEDVYVGLFVCSHNPDVVEEVVFRNVRLVRPASD